MTDGYKTLHASIKIAVISYSAAIARNARAALSDIATTATDLVTVAANSMAQYDAFKQSLDHISRSWNNTANSMTNYMSEVDKKLLVLNHLTSSLKSTRGPPSTDSRYSPDPIVGASLVLVSGSIYKSTMGTLNFATDESIGFSRGRQLYQRGRVTNMRRTKGAVEMSSLQDEIRKKMFVGTNEEDALARLSEQQTLKAITLSITTRGIGLGICHLTFISISYHENIRVPSIYAMYRVFLGLLEAKLEAIKSDLPVIPRVTDHIKHPGVTSDMLRVAQSVTIVPEPIRRIINAIGYLKYEDKVYVPAVAADPVDRHNIVTPRPENVLLSTLRRTVEFLANAESSAGVRRRFHENCAIPGAIWVNDILQNPDEIMPRGYNMYEDFRRESMLIAPFLVSLQKHVPKLVANTEPIDPSGLLIPKLSNLENNEIEHSKSDSDDCTENNVNVYVSSDPSLWKVDEDVISYCIRKGSSFCRNQDLDFKKSVRTYKESNGQW
ncbi:unnamed protein product [Arctia plantaginis]|uniref:Uncharacterized protein n=1 Tax=Arctia plantaginis TaxID=874455 RepID=A0A8S1B367_ARCPL|nr:unnamed protein product [Arctia plantaginis]